MAGDGTLRLDAGDATVVIDPDRGGRLAALEIEGHPLLFSARSMALQWGAYPMVPWAGRVADGRFRFAGATHQLPRNVPPHSAHGTGFVSPWRVEANDDRRVDLSLELTEPWPLGGRVVQHIELEPGQLRLELSVEAGRSAMPAMVGWHPWFNRSLGRADGAAVEAKLRFEAESMYELDDRAIPTGRLVPPPPRPWDNCFTGVATGEADGPALIWPDLVELRLSSSCDHWVVYDRPGHAICVEPQSAAPDVFNRQPAVLDPGDRLEAWFQLEWR
ncbi:MAG: aldose epimerase [Actinomycetota bacterium]